MQMFVQFSSKCAGEPALAMVMSFRCVCSQCSCSRQYTWPKHGLTVTAACDLCCVSAGVPVVFGVLTCDTMEQVRAQPLLQADAVR
jgi:hypothetical protein